MSDQVRQEASADVNVDALARRARASELARIHRVSRKGPSLLERVAARVAALWKRRKATEGQVATREKVEGGAPLAPPLESILPQPVVEEEKQSPFKAEVVREPLFTRREQEPGWQQYKPWAQEGEEQGEKAPPSTNMATIRAMAKKIMAREWAQALGRPRTDSRLNSLETEAAAWQQRKAEEEQLAEELKAGSLKQRRILEEALKGFAGRLRDQAQGPMDPQAASRLLEEALDEVGELFEIHWQEGSCWIWLEPWEEKRRRRASGERLPVIYQAQINDQLELVEYAPIQDDEAKLRLKEQSLTKPLEQALHGVKEIHQEMQAQELLEEALFEVGRLLRLDRTQTGWAALVEPWEEMRYRNAKQGGKGEVAAKRIEIRWLDGRLEVLSNGENALAEEEDLEKAKRMKDEEKDVIVANDDLKGRVE